MEVQPVILCGGSGTRLWPLSDESLPKQFHSLESGGPTLCEATKNRLSRIPNSHRPLFVVNTSHRHLIDGELVLEEEVACDTGVAIARALKWTLDNRGHDVILLIAPADHAVGGEDRMLEDIAQGLKRAANNPESLVLFGLEATFPETKYGYILPSTPVSFMEKPDVETAYRLVSRGALWNSGIVAGRAGAFLEAYRNHCPSMLEIAGFFPTNRPAQRCPSFDTAVLQRFPQIEVIKCEGWIWSDVGTWDSWVQSSSLDKEPRCYTAGCWNSKIINRGNGRVVTIGANDILVVVNGEDVLVTTLHPRSSDLLKTLVSSDEFTRRGNHALCLDQVVSPMECKEHPTDL